jgi:hypothetical protein
MVVVGFFRQHLTGEGAQDVTRFCGSTGQLRVVETAIGNVLMAVQELHSRSKIRPTDTDPALLINAFYHFMIAACAMWTELVCQVSLNTRQGTPQLCVKLFNRLLRTLCTAAQYQKVGRRCSSQVAPSVVRLLVCASFMPDQTYDIHHWLRPKLMTGKGSMKSRRL